MIGMAYNFDDFFQRVLKLFKQILNDPTSDHPLKHIFTNEDLDRLAENPPSMEDISKIMQYFANNPGFNQFFQNNPAFNQIFQNNPISPKKPSAKDPPENKESAKESQGADLIVDTFEFGNEIHVLIGTSRTDLDFKTGIKKSDPDVVALIVRDKTGSIIRVLKLPSTIDQKTKRITFQNGTYEIVYKKRN